MKNLVVILCFYFPFLLFGQNELKVTFSINDKNTTLESASFEYLLADNVALRSTPSRSGDILSRLKIGSQLLLKDISSHTMILNNIKSHWYLVEVNDLSGWLWGGLIALESFDSTTDPSIKFVSGYAKSTFNAESETFKCQYQIRAVKKNKQLDKIIINTTDEIATFENLGKKGLDNVDDILKGKTLCGAYDCLMQLTYVFWNHGQFYKVFELTETVDEDQEGIHNFEALTFPADENGVADLIIQTTNVLDFVGPTTEETVVYMITSKDFYTWDGTKIQSSGRETESTTVNTEKLLEKGSPDKLNLQFSSISEQDFQAFKNNYDDKISLDTTKIQQPGASFFLETAAGVQEFPCSENYDPCYYYDGYLEPLKLYLITEGHPYYAQAFAIGREDGKRFPFYSPFDSAANSILISKEEDQLLVFTIEIYQRASFIAVYQILQKKNKVYFSGIREFRTDKWNIDELAWIDNNSFALKVYDQSEWSEEENTTVLRDVRYLKANFSN